MKGKKVFVAMSGGVDSSVAAALLKERGFDVVGVHIKMWAPESDQWLVTSDQYDGVCRQQYQDRIDATRVAAHLGIPFQTWDLTKEYREAVVAYLIREYAAGRTPNPDVMCNRHIKFGVFLQRALQLGADYIATGHYVRSKKQEARSTLEQAKDLNKDQSYFLWTLGQEQLRHALFPIGEYTKTEVRELAKKYGLPTAEKDESQGICFIGEIDLTAFLKKYIPERKGAVVTSSGEVIGEHDGAAYYTIGQRRGIRIGGRPTKPGEPRPQRAGGILYYVAEKDIVANTVTVAEGPYDETLFRNELIAADMSWISGTAPKLLLRCAARIRYRQPLQKCAVTSYGLRATGDSLLVTFDEPQRAVTPGQSIVFYRGKSFGLAQDSEMLGGAIIQ